MSEEPLYFSRQQLAVRAGVSLRRFAAHEAGNVGDLRKARETHGGIGLVYASARCRKYLALCAATQTRRKSGRAAG